MVIFETMARLVNDWLFDFEYYIRSHHLLVWAIDSFNNNACYSTDLPLANTRHHLHSVFVPILKKGLIEICRHLKTFISKPKTFFSYPYTSCKPLCSYLLIESCCTFGIFQIVTSHQLFHPVFNYLWILLEIIIWQVFSRLC